MIPALLLVLLAFAGGCAACAQSIAAAAAEPIRAVLCATGSAATVHGETAGWLNRSGRVPDRRQTAREPMSCGARLEVAGRAWAVNLLDLSEAGAGIQAPSDIVGVGAEGRLVIDTAVLPVQVVSVGPARLSVVFGPLSAHATATIGKILS
nr:PilZ domain-containing protein [Roseomonas fluvialis]